MEYRVKVTVLDKKLFPELQAQYCAVPNSGKCPCFNVGDEFMFYRNNERDDYWHMGAGTLIRSGNPDEGVSRHKTLRNRRRSVLFGSVGCNQQIYLFCASRGSNHARMDKRR
mgnify:CR=1 FL=1